MAIPKYRGYSSYEYQNTRSFVITDVDVIKLDLLNHMFTVKGSRIMMSTFGTRIPLLPFEPLDEVTLLILEEDIKTVIMFDPRVKLVSLTVTPSYDTNTVVASATLRFVELNITDKLDINLDFNN